MHTRAISKSPGSDLTPLIVGGMGRCVNLENREIRPETVRKPTISYLLDGIGERGRQAGLGGSQNLCSRAPIRSAEPSIWLACDPARQDGRHAVIDGRLGPGRKRVEG